METAISSILSQLFIHFNVTDHLPCLFLYCLFLSFLLLSSVNFSLSWSTVFLFSQYPLLYFTLLFPFLLPPRLYSPFLYSTQLSSTPVLSPLFCSTLLIPVESAWIDFEIRTRTRPWTGTAHTVSIQTIWTWMSRIKFLHEFCKQSVSKAYKCDEMCVKYSSLLYWLLFLLIVK